MQYFVYSILGFGTLLECILIDSSQLFIVIISIIFNIVIIGLDVYYYFYSKKLYKRYEQILS
jgi:hypothetical protein